MKIIPRKKVIPIKSVSESISGPAKFCAPKQPRPVDPKKVYARVVAKRAAKKITEQVSVLSESAINPDGSLDEKKFNRGCAQVAKYTDNNYHAKAIAHGAKLIGRDDIAKTASDIEKQHVKDGHLTDENYKKRKTAYTDLMRHSEKTLSPEQHKKLYMSF